MGLLSHTCISFNMPFTPTSQRLLASFICLWKGRPDWSPRIVISCLVLTPQTWLWKFRVSSKTLSQNMAMINSPFQVLFEGMECRWNIIHLPVLSEQMKSSFIHLIESRCSLYDRTTNLSICMSAEDTSHGTRESLANNVR